MQAQTKKILIVEDEAPLSNVLSERLSNEGFTVFVAADGEQGLAMALDHKPDLVLLDILLPKMGGLSMLKELRTHEEGKTIPVMMLTNLNDTEDVNEALAAGAYDYLVKSDWNIADLVDNIRNKLAPPAQPSNNMPDELRKL